MRGSTPEKRGKGWTIVIDLPRNSETGKRRRKRITARTKPEAEAEAAKVLASIASGGFAEADANKITVAEYLTRWLESIGQTVRPMTQRRYRDLVRLHVIPKVGTVRLAKLTPLDLQHLYADRLAADSGKLSGTTVNNIHVVLHRALKDAMRWGLLTRNVTEAVTPPRKAAPVTNAWSQRQASAFLAIADRDDLAALWRLALFTGMRRGELLVLVTGW